MRPRIKIMSLGAATVALLVLMAGLMGPVAQAETDGKTTVLVHVTSVPKAGKDQFFSVPGLALEVLKREHRMIILFDGRAAKVARLGHWYGGDTSILDKIKIEAAEREQLARRMGIPASSMPDNYGNLLRLLKGRGVELYVNHDAMRRLGIDDDEYDTAIVPVNEEQMLDIFESADVSITY